MEEEEVEVEGEEEKKRGRKEERRREEEVVIGIANRTAECVCTQSPPTNPPQSGCWPWGVLLGGCPEAFS